jgi:cyclic pyranopterin phosphate synthase
MTGDDVAAVFAQGLAPGSLPDVRQFDLDDMETATQLCLFLMGGNRVKQETGGTLNHFDAQGRAVMVDVGDKPITQRTAVASGRILVNEAVYRAVTEGTAKKGDVLGVARLAGIMAAKRTSDMIPLCHPLFLSKCTVDFELQPEERAVQVMACVKTSGQTGVEMEALHAVSVALLTIYDMCKALDRRMEIREIHLERKEGGKSGTFVASSWQ